MNNEGSRKILLAVFVTCVVAAFLVLAASGRSRNAPQSADVERGKYLVEEVAECGECHTPRDAQGNVDKHAWLQGAPIWISPVRHIPNWADQVPPIAGLGGFTEVQVERVLEQGTGPENEVLRPPMHTYHMKPADAKAIVAYLKSVPAERH